jgi:hypothetical protein
MEERRWRCLQALGARLGVLGQDRRQSQRQSSGLLALEGRLFFDPGDHLGDPQFPLLRSRLTNLQEQVRD